MPTFLKRISFPASNDLAFSVQFLKIMNCKPPYQVIVFFFVLKFPQLKNMCIKLLSFLI